MATRNGPAPQLRYPANDHHVAHGACSNHSPQSSISTTYADTSANENLFHELAGLAVDSREFQRKVDEIVRLYLPLADAVARRFARRGEPQDDLVQVARLGLLLAVQRFDTKLGTGFISFAVPTIMGGLRRHFRDNTWSVRVPRRLKELNGQLNIATSELYQRFGRTPTVAELAEELGAECDEVIEALLARNCRRTIAIDGGMDDDDGPRAPISALGRTDDLLERIESQETVRLLLQTLPDRERTVMQLRFFESRTQTEIALRLGVSQMHVSRLLRKSLSCLRHQLQDF